MDLRHRAPMFNQHPPRLPAPPTSTHPTAAPTRQIRTFATASPVPGFRRWLETTIESHRERPQLAALAPVLAGMSEPEWVPEKQASELAQKELPGLCAHYFLHANNGSKEPLDSVARFHLRNGARLERINWLGDLSPKGLRESAGVMVNYLYRLDDIEENHEAYANEGEVVASNAVKKLLKNDRRLLDMVVRPAVG